VESTQAELYALLIGPIIGTPTGSASKSPGGTAKIAKPKPVPAQRR
jgi:hypothetical protein